MAKIDIQNPDRRNFLRTAPIAAAATLTLADASMFSSIAQAQTPAPSFPGPYTKYTAQQFGDIIKGEGANGTKTIYFKDQGSDIALTTETATTAKDYEWHEYRDHVFYILEGSTMIEIGGTPGGAHKTRPGEWLAPTCEGAEKVTLNRGDFIVIPRGTPHKRSTTGHVVFTLVAPRGPVPAT